MINNEILAFCSALIAIIMLSSGCGVYLGPGLTSTAAHLESPAYKDEKASTNYVSAQVGIGNRFNDDDNNFYGSLSFHRANTFEYGSVTYGAFGYLGNYRLGQSFELPAFAGDKPYGGFGIVAGGNFHVPFKHVDWEIFKFTTRLYNELGEYPRFKRELISVNREDDYFEDMYINHGRMVDMAFGTGLKIKHKNMSTTRISVGLNGHVFSKSCNDNGKCDWGESRLVGLNFQVGHSLAERVSFNFMLSSGVRSNDDWFWRLGPGPSHAIANFGVSYRF